MTVVGLILVILLIIPGVLAYWAIFKSGELQTIRARWRAMHPTMRRRARTTLLVSAIVGTGLAALVLWAFSAHHTAVGLAILVGLVVLNGVVTPLLRARAIRRKSTSASSQASEHQ